MDHRGKFSFTMILFSADEHLKLENLLKKWKRDTDILIEIDKINNVYVLLCQSTDKEGGEQFGEILMSNMRLLGGTSGYCVETEVQTTAYTIQEVIFTMVEKYIEIKREGIMYKEKNNQWHKLEDNSIVSMNLWGFTPSINKLSISILFPCSCAFLNTKFSVGFKVEERVAATPIFLPFLTDLYKECDQVEGYWTFLEKMYPILRYEKGETDEYVSNSSESYLFDFIQQINDLWSVKCENFPHYDSLVTNEYVYVIDEDESETLVNADDVDLDYKYEYGDPDVVGWVYEIS